ncbi:MAG TPA: hypothetical protein V6C98_02545, partial [Thermosynechococcaceae cyanobacterium]
FLAVVCNLSQTIVPCDPDASLKLKQEPPKVSWRTSWHRRSLAATYSSRMDIRSSPEYWSGNKR